jgi:hypothetical protein
MENDNENNARHQSICLLEKHLTRENRVQKNKKNRKNKKIDGGW